MSVEALPGQRVELMAPTFADEAPFLEAMRRSRGLHHPWVYPPLDGQAFDRFLQDSAREGARVFLVRTVFDEAICGVVALNLIVYRALRSACLSYYGVDGHNQKGLIKEGLLLLIGHAFRDLGLNRLEANIQPGNTASIELVRNLGFRREGFSPAYLNIAGQWRDHERWALLAREFSPS